MEENIYDTPLSLLREKKVISTRLFNTLVRNSVRVYNDDVNTTNVTLRQILNEYTHDNIKAFRQMGKSHYEELMTLMKSNDVNDLTGAPGIMSLKQISDSINSIKITPDTGWDELYKKVACILNKEFEKHGIELIEDYSGEENGNS